MGVKLHCGRRTNTVAFNIAPRLVAHIAFICFSGISLWHSLSRCLSYLWLAETPLIFIS